MAGIEGKCGVLIKQTCEIPISDKAKVYIKRKIMHKMVEKEDECDESEVGTLKEYIATVISTVPGYPAWFNLKYEDSDGIYVEQLQQEMDKGHIVLVPKLKETKS